MSIKASDGPVSNGDHQAHLRQAWQKAHGIWPGIFSTGSWTPTDDSGASLSLTIGGATWVKIGPLVWASGFITYPATADGTNSKIGGLPFTIKNDEGNRGGGMVSYTSVSTGVICLPMKNTKQITWRNPSGGAVYTNANLSAKVIVFSALYMTTEG